MDMTHDAYGLRTWLVEWTHREGGNPELQRVVFAMAAESAEAAADAIRETVTGMPPLRNGVRPELVSVAVFGPAVCTWRKDDDD